MEAVKSLGKLDSISLSNYILQRYSPMSHLKLQKLLYYSEAYHLAYFDEGLTDCEFQAWVHGPVCREVFDNLKDKSLLYADLQYEGEDQIEKVKAVLTSTQIQVLDDVLAELSKWTDIELETATHNELPWISARGGIDPGSRCSNIIDRELIRTFYKKDVGLAN
jgi:uncharacterized phage-associated protein